METVTSRDGTTIAFDRRGAGPALVLITGALGTRAGHQPLAALLAEDFTVFNYDRRGRADSGDTPPYAVEREVEDIDAVIEAAGGNAYLYGTRPGRSWPSRRRASSRVRSRSWPSTSRRSSSMIADRPSPPIMSPASTRRLRRGDPATR